MTSVLLVDDHPIVRQGLRSLISNQPTLDVVGEASDVAGAMDAFRTLRPDVSLVDIRLGPESGLDLLDMILDEAQEAKVLIVSSFDDDEYVMRSLRAGALGYVHKADSPAVLVTAIETVAAGQLALGPRVTAHLVDQVTGGSERGLDLDNVEVEMLRLISRGFSNARIGDELFLSDTTVKRRLRVVFDKLGVARRTEAVAEATKRGLV
jgi:DNA-binding NarL/FixJ family response regulator